MNQQEAQLRQVAAQEIFRQPFGPLGGWVPVFSIQPNVPQYSLGARAPMFTNTNLPSQYESLFAQVSKTRQPAAPTTGCEATLIHERDAAKANFDALYEQHRLAAREVTNLRAELARAHDLLAQRPTAAVEPPKPFPAGALNPPQSDPRRLGHV